MAGNGDARDRRAKVVGLGARPKKSGRQMALALMGKLRNGQKAWGVGRRLEERQEKVDARLMGVLGSPDERGPRLRRLVREGEQKLDNVRVAARGGPAKGKRVFG